MKFYKNILLTAALWAAVSTTLSGQIGCPVTEQYYTKQSQVDSFLIKYPLCENVTAKITLFGPEINNLSGFQNVKALFIGGLHLEECESLGSLTGLEKVSYLAGLNIRGKVGIDTLKAWPALDYLHLRIQNNSTIKSLAGLASVEKVRELFLENTKIKNLDGIAGDSILFDLNLKSNTELEEVNALTNKKEISRIFIENNTKLKHIDGLNNVNKIMDLHIKENHEMTRLPDFNEVRTINNIFLRDDPAKSKIVNIPRFEKLKQAKDITIFGLYKAETYTGFDSLSICGKLLLQNLGAISIKGFQKLEEIYSLGLISCGRLENVEAFENVTIVNSGIGIASCGVLKLISGLNNIKKLYGLVFSYNHINFERLDCFTSLEEITKDLQMENNQKMHSVYFPKLRKIGGKIHLQNNRRLESIEGFGALEEVGALYITGNEVLQSLKPLEKLDWRLLDYIQLRINYACTDCSIPPVCEYLKNTTNWDFFDKIELNGANCKTALEILENCETTDTENETQPSIRITNPVYETVEVHGITEEIKTVELYSIEGTKIRASMQTAGDTRQYDVSHLRPGMYLLHFMTNNQKTGTIKWIKM